MRRSRLISSQRSFSGVESRLRGELRDVFRVQAHRERKLHLPGHELGHESPRPGCRYLPAHPVEPCCEINGRLAAALPGAEAGRIEGHCVDRGDELCAKAPCKFPRDAQIFLFHRPGIGMAARAARVL